jgi:hypothetical protein
VISMVVEIFLISSSICLVACVHWWGLSFSLVLSKFMSAFT